MPRFLFLPLLLALACSPALADSSIYEPAIHELDNGMRVVLKERHHARTASIRLVVGVGHLHSPCKKQQGAHLLEHLTFAGYDDLTEADINRKIDGLGGYDNAFTGMYQTSYVFDTFGPNTSEMVATLFAMVSRPALRPADIEAARRIVASEDQQDAAKTQEFYGDIDRVRSSLSRGYRHLLSDVLEQQECISVVSRPELVRRDDLLRLHRQYYVPNNMTLIVVGDFDSQPLLSLIGATFGRLQQKPLPPAPFETERAYETSAASFEGNFDFSHAYVMTRTDGYSSPDYYALKLLFDHLDNRMYEIFRIEHPLAYSPEAYVSSEFDYGVAQLGANVPESDFQTAQVLIGELLEEVTADPLPQETITTLQHKAVVEGLMALETNSALADYYELSLFELERHGHFVNEAEVLRALGPADLRRVANTYFRDDRLVWVKDRGDSTGGQSHKNAR